MQCLVKCSLVIVLIVSLAAVSGCLDNQSLSVNPTPAGNQSSHANTLSTSGADNTSPSATGRPNTITPSSAGSSTLSDGGDIVGTIVFDKNDYTVNKTAGTVALTLDRIGPASSQASVTVYTTDGSAFAGTDYGSINDVVTFQPGETSKTITVPILNDGNLAPQLYFYVNATDPVGADVGTITQLNNVPKPLAISTYDGSNEAMHPKVIYTATPWNGYQYIMSMTPYPGNKPAFENPSLRVSNDGINWVPLPGSPDPIIPAPADVERGGYNDDPDIMLVGSTLYFFYTDTPHTGASGDTIYYTTTTDGINWTPSIQTNLPAILSPTMYYNGFEWQCWGVDVATKHVRHFVSEDATSWTESGIVTCNIPGYKTWHPSVISTPAGYEMLVAAYTHDNVHTKLFAATSPDGLNWTIANNGNPILAPTQGGWDGRQIYRSSFLKDANGNYRIWYSAANNSSKWGIGYISLPYAATVYINITSPSTL